MLHPHRPLEIPRESITAANADHPVKEASKTSKTEHAALEEKHGAHPSQSTRRGTRAPASPEHEAKLQRQRVSFP